MGTCTYPGVLSRLLDVHRLEEVHLVIQLARERFGHAEQDAALHSQYRKSSTKKKKLEIRACMHAFMYQVSGTIILKVCVTRFYGGVSLAAGRHDVGRKRGAGL